MKTLTTVTLLLAASMAATSQVNAASQQMGQAYDPQNDYYENYNLSSDKTGINSSATAVSTSQTSATTFGLDWPYGDDESIVLSQPSKPTVKKVPVTTEVMYGFSFPYGN